MDDSQGREVCRLVAGIVVSDDELDPKEEAFIDRMLVRFGLTPDDRDLIFPIVESDEAADAIRGLPAAVHDEVMGLLVEAAAVDGTIADEERSYLQAVADVIGVSADDLSGRIEKALAS